MPHRLLALFAATLMACGAATTGTTDGGMTGFTGPIDAHTGGKVSDLLFAVVGDTRPANEDDTQNYPTAIITGIYQALAKVSPGPQFVITTGDYMFASTSGGSTAPQQMQMYLNAASLVTVPRWPVMGNHECTGATASNCAALTETVNIRTFMSEMMTPIGETKPYYVRNVNAEDGSWTAKFVFVAANAWSTDQQTWLDSALSVPTTYTFLVKHESAGTSGTPSISAIKTIVANHPVTLGIVGHTHTWDWRGGEVIIGNGGAPISGSSPYGYTLFQRRSDGAIVVTAYDYTTGRSFQTHAITASGAATN